MTPNEQAREIVKQFGYRSDCELSLADIQWLIASITQAIAQAEGR